MRSHTFIDCRVFHPMVEICVHVRYGDHKLGRYHVCTKAGNTTSKSDVVNTCLDGVGWDVRTFIQ
jgi:hypothetical protein